MFSLHRLIPPALALLVAATGTIQGQEPRTLKLDDVPQQTAEHPNRQLAQAVAKELQASGKLANYRIDIICRNGKAELTGTVASAEQRDAALRMAKAVPGVAQVVDQLKISCAITQIALQEATKTPDPEKIEPEKTTPELVPTPRKVEGDAPIEEPLPSFRAGPNGGGSASPTGQAPPMPPYAWPTYAPHNNYSRVAYPQAYPNEQFPNMGPVYPFPKVPLGWRKVVLEWDDGHWWLSSRAQPRDWWVLRFW